MINIVTEFLKRNNEEYELSNNYISFRNHRFIITDNPESVFEECRKNLITIITINDYAKKFPKQNGKESNGHRYLHKCPEPIIGVDIELFKEDCPFPYRDDRPECFYKVISNSTMSSYDAFNTESIRLDMIINRIDYAGGFINGNSILQALNITRKAKQPSWYSVSFAERVMARYCTEPVVIDPFAGWGARCDAARKLNKRYIACDLNEELVDWHHKKGRTEIQYGDATQFKYDKDDAVLYICPPYQDVEIYGDFQLKDHAEKSDRNSGLGPTQCEWLEMTFVNCPNAKRYVMTCKVIDNHCGVDYNDYIIEDKVNKSHFGTNKEHVLVVENEQAKDILRTLKKNNCKHPLIDFGKLNI